MLAMMLAALLVFSGVVASDEGEVEGGGANPPEKEKEVVIGIDLGTTYSCVAVVEKDGTVKVIADASGNVTTPSWVAFTDQGTLVGQAAKNQVDVNPRNTIYDTKRLIGQSYKKVKADLKHYSFQVEEHKKKPRIVATNRGQEFRFAPEEISAMILARMKEIAEAYLGQPVERAVITVRCARALCGWGPVLSPPQRRIAALVSLSFQLQVFDFCVLVCFPLLAKK